jgi:hypothetical protein
MLTKLIELAHHLAQVAQLALELAKVVQELPWGH